MFIYYVACIYDRISGISNICWTIPNIINWILSLVYSVLHAYSTLNSKGLILIDMEEVEKHSK